VDEMKQRVTCLRLDAHGKYQVVRPVRGELHSDVISGFWLRPEWLWQTPLPGILDVFQMISAPRE
jgi:hypothetical protein